MDKSMERSMQRIAADILWGLEDQPKISTVVPDEINVGDWFRVVLVGRTNDQTVATLVRQSPSVTSSPEKTESGSVAPQKPRRAGERSP